jgi:magnesium-transporting ATPase (P-type)
MASSVLLYPLHHYPVAFVDYLWVVTVYSGSAFSLAMLLDGYLLPPFDPAAESKQSSWYLAIKVLLQFTVQGFIAIFMCAFLLKLPSPVRGLGGYDTHSKLGNVLRNPAIVSVVLFALSSSLRSRLLYLFSRFDHHVRDRI